MFLLPLAYAAPTLIESPDTILGDWPEYVDPIAPEDFPRYQDDPWIDDASADLTVRAWRYDASVGGLVETHNQLRSDVTALILVHPWGIDDGQGWGWPQAYNAYGYVFEGLYDDNQLYLSQVDNVVAGWADRLRGRVPLVVYSLPGGLDATRRSAYRSFEYAPGEAEREAALTALQAELAALEGSAWPTAIPVVANLDAAPDDIVSYDDQGGTALIEALQAYGIEHVLLGGWATDMCVVSTPAGYQSLITAFDVLLVGDTTMAAWPTTASPPNGYVPIGTTDALLSAASLDGLAVTQVSWIEALDRNPPSGPSWRGEDGSFTALFDNWQARPDASAPDRAQSRRPDWASASAPELVGAPFDAEAIALAGTRSGRINVAVLPAGQALTVQVGALSDPTYEIQVHVRWAPDTDVQSAVWTWTDASGAPTTLSQTDDLDVGDGWRETVWTAEVAGGDNTSLTLGFDAGEGVVDQVVLDMRPLPATETPEDTAPEPDGDTDSGGGAPNGEAPADTNAQAKAAGCGCRSGLPVGGWAALLGVAALRRRPQRR